MAANQDKTWWGWWYSGIGELLWHHQKLLILTVVDFFSFEILFKTLFQPWKRDIISSDHLSLGERINTLALNMVARLIGAVIRTAAIVAGIISLFVTLALFLLLWIAWAGAPLIGIGFLIWALIIWRGAL